MNHAFLSLLIVCLLVSSCADAHRNPVGWVGFNDSATHGTRVIQVSEVGEPRPEQERDMVASSAVVLDAALVSCFPFSGVNGPSTNDGFAQAAFFFVVKDVRLGRWVGNTISVESSDRVSPNKGDIYGLGAGFYTLRDKYRFYLSSDTVQTSGVVTVRRLTDTTASLPEREAPAGWEPVKDSTSDKEIPGAHESVKGIEK